MNYYFKYEFGNRGAFYCLFSSLYLLFLVYKIYINPFELVSDIQSYYLHFLYGGLSDFGVEFLLPAMFLTAKIVGLGFYDFVFLLGVLYLYPILRMARLVRTPYLIIYFSFFLLYFVPNYAFLMRQYFSFFLIVVFLLNKSRSSYFFLVLSLFAHLSALILVAIIISKNSRFWPYVAFLSVGVFVSSLMGFSLMQGVLDLLNAVSVYLDKDDLIRKVDAMAAHTDFDAGSASVYFILSLSVILHSIYMIRVRDNNLILLIMFASSCLSLLLSESSVISNRIGFAGYFFSLPYFSMVVSLFCFVDGYKLRLRSCCKS
ncbi:EpsG family protein [Pseudomonas sp. 5Ae-yellow]|uniref:EpsG family protein n=1 Tax=Pseudomonas sp. 5Ae-yellow TaxID=2759848 RepID=UPI0015F62090|nr:EpsG family protein [Pseudomonas sp. 5Ae-yellow]MBA6420854.1 EpsG family protein [Pseudomonas sp. 5Ae-yellow]